MQELMIDLFLVLHSLKIDSSQLPVKGIVLRLVPARSSIDFCDEFTCVPLTMSEAETLLQELQDFTNIDNSENIEYRLRKAWWFVHGLKCIN